MDVETAAANRAKAKLQISERLRVHADAVDLRISPTDGMGSGDVHYWTVGASALDAIVAAIRLSGGPDPARILDFGSGAGRVTRWLKVAFPHARLCCCDIRVDDVAFCRDVFGAEAWVSGVDVEALDFHGRYDLIWMGSVLTHLDEPVSRRLVDRAVEALNPGGVLVASVSGRAIRVVQDRSPIVLQGQGWPAVKRGFDRSGYGYVDYDGEVGYGISLTSLAWVTGLASSADGRRLVMMSERAWDGLQDVFALQADAASIADPSVLARASDELDALRRRIEALEASSSWRLTAPLRRLVTVFRRMT